MLNKEMLNHVLDIIRTVPKLLCTCTGTSERGKHTEKGNILKVDQAGSTSVLKTVISSFCTTLLEDHKSKRGQ